MKYNMTEFKTVEDVVRSDLCMGCGMCEVVCPAGAIKVSYNPLYFHNTAEVDTTRCILCNHCLEVCSGWQVDHPGLSIKKFQKVPENPYLGVYDRILSAWSEDKMIREAGASGGFVTQLLLNLLDKDIIDAALIVKPGEAEPLNPQIYLAKNKEEILAGQGSSYLSASLCRGLKEVLENRIRIAIVALPCQINSLLKSYELQPELKNQIVFTIGLFCNGVFTQKSIFDYCQMNNIDHNQIERIDFRWGAWPGRMRIKLKNGDVIKAKRDSNFKINYMRRCYFCYDQLADKADVSVGDNWGDEDPNGKNIVIIRNPNVLKYLSCITVENYPVEDLYETHRIYHSRRRYNLATRKIASLAGKKYPDVIPYKNLKSKFWVIMNAWLDWKVFNISTRASSLKARILLRLRGFLQTHLIYSQPVPENLSAASDEKKRTVLISEGDLKGNKGAVAMVDCIIRDLQRAFPRIEFIVTSKQISRNVHLKKNLRILHIKDQVFEFALVRAGIWWLFKQLGIRIDALLKHNIIESYQKADIIISATGISFIDDFGYRKVFHYARYVILPLLLDKRIIKFTQSFGPIKSNYNRLLAGSVLPLAEVVIARGKHSKDNLRKAGIKKNVITCPDIAITLEPEFTQHVSKELISDEIIGISPNMICKKLAGDTYMKTMHTLVKHISEEMPEKHILFIPHTISELKLKNENDLSLCQELAKPLKTNYKIADTIKMTPGELKALIGKCDFFVGSRYHSLVAAVSMAVPCLAIGWHWKYNELMDWYDITDNIVNIWDLNRIDIRHIFNDLYSDREQRKHYLTDKNIQVEELAAKATKLIIEKLKK